MNRYAAADTVVSDAAPVAPHEAPPPSAPGNPMSRFDFQQSLAGDASGRSPVNAMILDQLIRLIAADPMVPTADDAENQDPLSRPLNAGGLRGSDWANALSRSLTQSDATPPAARPAARAYDETADPAPPRAVNDVI
jgi:hypothetical protein